MTSQKLDCGGGGSERAQFCKTYADKSIMAGATDIDRWTIQLIKRFTDRQKQTDSKKTKDRQTEKTNRQTNRKNKQTDKQTNRQTNRQKNRQTNRQTDKQTDRQTTHTSEKQRDKQTDSRLADFQNRQKERQTEKQAQIVNKQTNRSGKPFRETGY